MITWTPDGAAVVLTKTGGSPVGLQTVQIADGAIKPLNLNGTHPRYSPKGDLIAFLVGGGAAVASATGGQVPGGSAGTDGQPAQAVRALTQAVDRGMARALSTPDGRTLLIGGNDTERVSLWLQPVEPGGGPARRLNARLIIQETPQLPRPARMLQFPERLGFDLPDAPRVSPRASVHRE